MFPLYTYDEDLHDIDNTMKFTTEKMDVLHDFANTLPYNSYNDRKVGYYVIGVRNGARFVGLCTRANTEYISFLLVSYDNTTPITYASKIENNPWTIRAI